VLMGRGSRYVRRDLAVQIGHRMIGIPEGENPLAREPHQVIGMRKHRSDRTPVCGLDAGRDGIRIEIGRRLVHDDRDPGDVELLRHPGRDTCALIVLLVRPHHDQELVRDHQGQERLLVQPRVGVDHERVEPEIVGELAESGRHELCVVPLAEHARDLTGLHARRDQEDPAINRDALQSGHILSDVSDRPTVPEEVVQRGGDLVPGDPEDVVDPR